MVISSSQGSSIYNFTYYHQLIICAIYSRVQFADTTKNVFGKKNLNFRTVKLFSILIFNVLYLFYVLKVNIYHIAWKWPLKFTIIQNSLKNFCKSSILLKNWWIIYTVKSPILFRSTWWLFQIVYEGEIWFYFWKKHWDNLYATILPVQKSVHHSLPIARILSVKNARAWI